jgi:hypothetical protein
LSDKRERSTFSPPQRRPKQPNSGDALKRRPKATTYRYLRHIGEKGETSLLLVRMRIMIRKFYWIM